MKREDINSFPKLKAGMVLEISTKDEGYLGLYLYINDQWLISTTGREIETVDIIIDKIYTVIMPYGCSGRSLMCSLARDNLELIYESKSYKDIKIEEIENTIEELKRQIKELKKK